MNKIEQLRALLERTHERDWETLMTVGQPHVCYITDSNDVGTVCCADTYETAQLIALMKNTLPALLDAAERLEDLIFAMEYDEISDTHFVDEPNRETVLRAQDAVLVLQEMVE